MKKTLLFISFFVSAFCQAQVSVQKLWVENLTNPTGLGVATPRFAGSWRVGTATPCKPLTK